MSSEKDRKSIITNTTKKLLEGVELTSRFDRPDQSKSIKEFRNLEYSFMIDHGYLLFDPKDRNTTFPEGTKERFDFLKKSLNTNVSSFVEDIVEDVFLPGNNYSLDDALMFICVAIADTVLHIVPGYHHTKHIGHYNPYTTPVTKDNIVFLHKKMMDVVRFEKENRVKLYRVILKSTANPAHSDDLWDRWDVFLTNSELTPLVTVQNADYFRKNPNIYHQFEDLERSGWGEFVTLGSDSLIFRIKPNSSVGPLKLGRPSLYESTIELVYYHDTRERLSHTNYAKYDVFEVRTGGILARSCNTRFSQDLYSLCCDPDPDDVNSEFRFDVSKIVDFFKNMNYDDLIRLWYPNNVKMEDGTVSDDETSEDGEEVSLKLRIKKRYSINLYKFDLLDDKNLDRIKMIVGWMDELKLRGGFILSEHIETPDGRRRTTPGYMLVAGEDIVITHHEKIGSLAVFQDRFRCLHWKKVRHYHYSNHDDISRLDYDNLPEKPFCLTLEDIEAIKSIDTDSNLFSDILQIPVMF